MSNEMFVLITAYAGLIMGTFVALTSYNENFIKKLVISMIVPIPVLVILVKIATSVAIDNSHNGAKWYYIKLSDPNFF